MNQIDEQTNYAKFQNGSNDSKTEYFLTDNDYYFEGDDEDVAGRDQ